MSFTCPVCHMVSHHPADEEHGYCGACHAFTDSRSAGVPPDHELVRFVGGPWAGQTQPIRTPFPPRWMVASVPPAANIAELLDASPPFEVGAYQLNSERGCYEWVG